MTPSVAPVLVAGAGPSGLVAALTLLQNNIPVRRNLHTDSASVAAVFGRVLLKYSTFSAHARPVLPLREYKPGTLGPIKTIITTPYNNTTPSIPYTFYVHTKENMDDGERVLAKLVKRKNGEETHETFASSYLVGADGAKGVTRKQLGLTFLGETLQDFSCLVGDLCLEIEGVDRRHRHIFGDRSSNFFTLRLTDEIAPDGFQFMITMKDYEPQQLLADQDLIVKCMSELTGHDISVRKAAALSVFRPNIRMTDRFGSGRVFIVGDAAHVHTPTGGQGLNASVQDAVCIPEQFPLRPFRQFNGAWKLALVHKGLSPITLLDSYTTERPPVIAEMLHLTTGSFHKLRSAPTIDGAMRHEHARCELPVKPDR